MPGTARALPLLLACLLLPSAAPMPAGPESAGSRSASSQSASTVGLNISASGNARLTALGTDGQGRPLLAWTESTTQGQGVFVRRLGVQPGEAGGAQVERWLPLGGNLNEDARHNAAQLTMATGQDGQPSLGWAEDSGTAHVDSYVVSRYDGTAWSDPSAYAVRRNLSDAGRSRAFVPAPVGAKFLAPLIAWTNIYYPGADGSVVQLLTWNGRGYDSTLPINRSLKQTAFFPAIALRPAAGVGPVTDGSPSPSPGSQPAAQTVVAWLEGNVAASNVYVSVRQAGGWVPLGGALNVRPHTYTFAPQLRLDAAGFPVVAWQEDLAGVDNLYLKRWTGQTWAQLGGSLNHNPRHLAERSALSLDASGNPVVAWSEERADGLHDVYARRWQNGRWVLLGDPAIRAGAVSGGADALSASVTVSGRGQVLVSWCEKVGELYRVRVRTFGGEPASPVGKS